MHAAATESDSELVRRAKAGEFAAFEALATRYERKVFALAMRMLGQVQDAEDVTQQTFLSALEGIGSFREESTFATWLLKIASHAALKLIRKRKGLPTISLEAATEPGDDSESIPHPAFIADWRDSPEELVQRREVALLLKEALGVLDEKLRIVFVLRDIEGLSIRETAGVLGLTEANTKVRLLRARLQLREALTRQLGDPATQIEPVAH